MKLEKLYKMQEKLDNHIWDKHGTLDKMSKWELLDSTILALLVEVGELGNATRCFKYWGLKGAESKERLLDELADIWHFYLSIGNQIKDEYVDIGTESGFSGLDTNTSLTFELLVLYSWIGKLGNECSVSGIDLEKTYQKIGDSIYKIIDLLDFTNEEVEQAYLKKHEENYKRQREGY